ncbi:gamma-glutamyltranspeptidase [Medicago truncatula]|uniref:Gamma-glutamyltranspeptidase n=1 Tax=Medicago truncatula TaxID=3880 RepID=G7KH50_MEDTR|nr:gamma-glutamyltranspeptidase [Medicago truncatula]
MICQPSYCCNLYIIENITCFLFVSNLAYASAKNGLTKTRNEVIIAHHGAVAADDHRFSKIGMAAIHEGGHAVDAVVAAALCLGVVSSASSGIGGGAFMLLRLANCVAKAFDMRETAPLLASKVPVNHRL